MSSLWSYRRAVSYMCQMGCSVHAQGPYKHLCQVILTLKKVHVQCSSKALLAGGEVKALSLDGKGNEGSASPPPLASVPLSSGSECQRLPDPFQTTVLTDGSDKLSWPVMSVGGYCCRSKQKLGRGGEGDITGCHL